MLPAVEVEDVNRFYEDLFVKNDYWSSPFPNPDEATRWGKIVVYVSQAVLASLEPETFRILDIGCGRGWMTNLLATFGTAEGIEPVPEVVRAAKQYFPHISFRVGAYGDLIDSVASYYDLIVASEVLEHISDIEKPQFIHAIQNLLRPNGYLVLTTPRGELQDKFNRRVKSGLVRPQPIEQWMTEARVYRLFKQAGLVVLDNTRAGPVARSNPLLWRLWRSQKFRYTLGRVRLSSLISVIEYQLCQYQVWWVQKAQNRFSAGS